MRTVILNNSDRYLGLWKLNINNNYWEHIEIESDPLDIKLKKRSAHSMILDNDNNLIIFGGNGKKNLPNMNYPIVPYMDMMSFNLKDNSLREIFHDYSKNDGPDVNFSSCVVYNSKKREMYVFGGGFKNDKVEFLTNNIWCFNFDINKWIKTEREEYVNYENLIFSHNIYNYGCYKIEDGNEQGVNIPCPRFAHCMLYSHKNEKGYILGGNPNLKTSKASRLNDFWSFELNKMTAKDLRDKLINKIYKFQFKEQCQQKDFKNAIKILNEKLSHKREKLIKHILDPNLSTDIDIYKSRYKLYEKIIIYFCKPDRQDELINR
jgi:hypothetical protein